MAKFIYLYRGPATPMEQFSEQERAEQMAAWGTWMEKVGPALTDGGSPFGARVAIRDNGGDGTAGDVNGYTIVTADDLEAARALTDGHPFLARSEGRFSIDIFELLPM
jgi:hypothetical protein